MEDIKIMATCICIILGILMCIGTILNLKEKQLEENIKSILRLLV